MCEVVLGNFLHSEQFIVELITPAFRIYLHFGQKQTPKSRKLSVAHNFSCGNGSLIVPWSAIYPELDTQTDKQRITLCILEYGDHAIYLVCNMIFRLLEQTATFADF